MVRTRLLASERGSWYQDPALGIRTLLLVLGPGSWYQNPIRQNYFWSTISKGGGLTYLV